MWRGDLAVAGIADGVDLGRHQSLGEGPRNLAQKVRPVLIEVLAQPDEGIHVGRDFHCISSQFVLDGLAEIDAVVVASGGPRETPACRRAPRPGALRFSGSERTSAGRTRTPRAGTQADANPRGRGQIVTRGSRSEVNLAVNYRRSEAGPGRSASGINAPWPWPAPYAWSSTPSPASPTRAFAGWWPDSSVVITRLPYELRSATAPSPWPHQPRPGLEHLRRHARGHPRRRVLHQTARPAPRAAPRR